MKKIGILVKKEMTEILRDKKTLIMMLVMPMILYPAMLIGVSFGVTMLMESQTEESQIVGYSLENEAYMEPIKALYEKEKEELESEIAFQGADQSNEEAVRQEADVWVSFTEKEGNIQIQVDYTSTNMDSNYAEDTMQELAELYRDEIMARNLEKKGLTEDFLYPVVYESVDSVSESESVGMYYGGTIGMVLISMIMLGAFYPAVDVTTGEKERGTLETLLTLPVTNFQMIMSKFIAVSIVACVTATVSLLAIGGSVLFLMLGVPEDMTSEVTQFPLETILSSIPVLLFALIATALFVTALSMCFCVFAKSSKEANNYMTPIMLVIMIVSMVGMIPTIELNYTYAIIPIVNVSLLIKQVLSQHLDLSLALITVGVNLGYSVLTIWILAKMYDSEDIMFSDGFRSFRLFQKRSDIKKGTIPATGDVVICLVVVFMLMVYIGSIFSARDVFVGTIVTQLIILITPLLLTWYMKTDKKDLFSLKAPKRYMIPASAFLYIGCFLLELVVVYGLTKVFPQSTENINMAFDEIMNHSFLAVVFVVAVMPAIGEELLFRGLTFGSLNSKYKAVWAILVSSLVFGLYHGSVVKLLPTSMLGACFAYIVYKGGSIYITMSLHFLNNFISVVSMKKPELIEKISPVLVKEELSSIEIIAMTTIGVIALIAGLLLIKNKKNVEVGNKVLTE